MMQLKTHFFVLYRKEANSKLCLRGAELIDHEQDLWHNKEIATMKKKKKILNILIKPGSACKQCVYHH